MTAPNTGQLAKTMTLRQLYELLRGQLVAERQSFLSHWKELSEYFQPRRGRFVTSDNNKGDKRNQKILDITGTLAVRTTSAGMQGGISSPSRPWFRLTTSDLKLNELAAVKEWLYEVTARMRTVFIRSNLYNVLPTMYTDISIFGTAAMAVLEDDDTVIRCQAFPIGSYMIANDEKGQVRVFMRDFQLTVRQLVTKFGRDKCSLAVRDQWDKGNLEQKYDVTHVVSPNYDYNGESNSILSKDLPFKSCYYERGTQPEVAKNTNGMLEEKGFHEFPVLCPRWEVTAEDTYGTNSPGMTALADVKQLQTGEKRALQAIDKQVNPPLVGPTSLRGNRVSLLPGDVTYNDAEPNRGLRALHETNFSVADLEAKQQQVRYRINEAFFVNLFLMMQYSDDAAGKQPKTAEEVRVRQEEKMLMLGPVLEQLNGDLFDQLIDRTFAIMDRRGLLPPIPSELQGQPLRVEYISIMAQAQKMVGLGGLERLANFVLPMAQVDPAVYDKIDRDEMIDQYAEASGVPPSVIVPDDEVAEIRATRAKAAQKQQQMQAINEASKGAKNLSETDTTGKNALTDLAGGSEGVSNLLQQALT